MISYIELINRFWQVDEQHVFSGNETRLYFYLLKVANSRNSGPEFTCSDARLTGELGIKRPTMLAARIILKRTKLIDFKGGHNPSDDALYSLNPAHKLSPFGESQVYLMMDTGGLCKIGTSENPKKRLKQIHADLGFDTLKLVSTFPGGHHSERAVQDHYKEQHVWAEWYSLSAHDVEVFQRLARMKNR